jgi:hypothetical protein
MMGVALRIGDDALAERANERFVLLRVRAVCIEGYLESLDASFHRPALFMLRRLKSLALLIDTRV